jgi:hypothetical protein
MLDSMAGTVTTLFLGALVQLAKNNAENSTNAVTE